MSLNISQGDYVYYTDTSTGGPTGWDWYFIGGSPTGSFAQNPVIRYLSSSPYYGYPVTLNISKGGLKASKTENNAIVVVPESLYIEVSATPDPNSVDMSTNMTYFISFGATGSIAYYTWNLPGVTGFTGPGSITSQSSLIHDWNQVTGTYYGSAYSTYTTFATVLGTSFLGNPTGNNVQVTYNKNGPDETTNFLVPGFSQSTIYYTASSLPFTTSSVGLPGLGMVLQIISPLGDLNNPYFRSHGENIFYSTSNMDIIPTGIIPLQLIASGSGLTFIGVPLTGWEILNRYTIGNYMLPSDVSNFFDGDLYVGDVNGILAALLKPGRAWTDTQVTSIGFETAVASQSSKNMELFPGYLPLATILGEDGYAGLSGGVGGCCLPSISITGATETKLYIDFYYSPDGSLQNIDSDLTQTIRVIISDGTLNGGMGNSPDGRLVLAQDTTSGSGIATLIQADLDNYIINSLGNPVNDFVIAEANPEYAYLYDSLTYDVNVFNGLKITILKNDPISAGSGPYLVKIGLRDNFLSDPTIIAPYNKTTAFGFSGISLYQGNWTCFGVDSIYNPAQNYNQTLPFPYRGFSYGTVPY